jgi:hypothetical protein
MSALGTASSNHAVPKVTSPVTLLWPMSRSVRSTLFRKGYTAAVSAEEKFSAATNISLVYVLSEW